MGIFKKQEKELVIALQSAGDFEYLCELKKVKFEIVETNSRARKYVIAEKDYEWISDMVYSPSKEEELAKGGKSMPAPDAQKPAFASTVQSAEARASGQENDEKETSEASEKDISPSEEEQEWAAKKTIEELKQLAGDQKPASQKTDKRKKRKSLGRSNQIKTRLTDAELVQFQRRVKKSGLSQGDYLRSAALAGEIRVEERSMADLALLDELALIRRELGKQGGLLKMIIKPNEGQRELAPEEWRDLIQTLRDMENIKKQLTDLEVRVQHGNSET